MKTCVLIGLLGVTLFAYRGVAANGWVYEDMAMQAVAEGAPGYSSGLVTRNLARWSVYRSARAFGPSPKVQHAVQLAVHLVNVTLLFWLALAFLPLSWAAAATAIVAWHPIQVETAAYVASRPDLLLTTWILFIVNLVIRPITWVRGGLIGAAFLLSLASKQTGVVLIPLILLILWWKTPAEREPFAWAVVGAVAVCFTLIWQVPHDPDALPYAGVWLAAYQSAAFLNLLWLVVWAPFAFLIHALTGVWLGGWFTIDHNVGIAPPAVALGSLILIATAGVWALRSLWRGDRSPAAWLLLWPLLLLAPRFVLRFPEFTNEHQFYPAMPAIALLLTLGLRALIPTRAPARSTTTVQKRSHSWALTV